MHELPAPASTTPARHEEQGDIQVYGGRGVARLVTEADPSGAIVQHQIRKNADVIDRLRANGAIDETMWSAGDRFRRDFQKAALAGHYVSLLADTTSRGSGEISDPVAEARLRIARALSELGRSVNSVLVQAAWHILGEQETLEDFALLMRLNGRPMNENKAGGVLLGTLERLALAYGSLTHGDIKEREHQNGFRGAMELAARYARALGVNAPTQEATRALERVAQWAERQVAEQGGSRRRARVVASRSASGANGASP